MKDAILDETARTRTHEGLRACNNEGSRRIRCGPPAADITALVHVHRLINLLRERERVGGCTPVPVGVGVLMGFPDLLRHFRLARRQIFQHISTTEASTKSDFMSSVHIWFWKEMVENAVKRSTSRPDLCTRERVAKRTAKRGEGGGGCR